MNSYKFVNGEAINMDTLNQRGKMIDNDLILNWQKISSISHSNKFAQLVPKIYKLQIKTKYGTLLNVNSENSISDHDKGDYIVCSIDKYGLPNLEDMWVVDGNVFKQTYEFIE
jgi:hypothetical protein